LSAARLRCEKAKRSRGVWTRSTLKWTVVVIFVVLVLITTIKSCM